MSEGTETISDYAFSWCYNLGNVYIPRSVTSIGENAFNGYNNLTIHGYSGSYAETFATEHYFTFKVVEE